MDQVDIYSYHGSVVKTHSMMSKPNSSVGKISHFEPVERGAFPVTKPATESKPKMSVAQPLAIQRPSRSTDKKAQNATVPHLYADQRVRQRSLSRESLVVPKPQKDVKKIVAFGRTMTVEDKSLNETAPPRPTINFNSHEVGKLRTDIEQLRGRVLDGEKLRKEMEGLQKSMKELMEVNSKMQEYANENERLRDDMKTLRSDFEAMSSQNGALVKRVSELEVQVEKAGKISNSSEKVPSMQIQSYRQQPVVEERRRSARTNDTRNTDMLFSRLAPTMNEQILQKKNEIQNRSDRMFHNEYYRQPYNRNDESSRYDYNASKNFKQKTFKNKENVPLDKKGLASNQVIDLNETYDKDAFQFDEE